MEVHDRGVLVAGGAGSLGSVVASALHDAGARVAVVDHRDPQAGSLPDGVAAFRADLADEAEAERALRDVSSHLGKISVLVNCAGAIHSEPLVTLTDPSRRRHRIDSWSATIRSNLDVAFVLGSLVAEHMATQRIKGVIVNFSSISASGNPGQTAYAAAKAGVEAMTRVWARELGPLGIRAVAIAPGFVDTPSTHAALSDTMLADLKRRTPLMRLAKPREIADAVRFVIENDFISGATVGIDGGLIL